MWNLIQDLLPVALVWASAAIFTPDPSIQDPRRIWQIETETPRNNLRSAMRDRGLAPPGSGAESRAERFAREIVVRRLVERVNEVYRRRPDGRALPGSSFDVTFFAAPPDDPRLEAGPGRAYSRICVGGAQTSCGGTLGTEYLDYGNRVVEQECTPSRIGVFAGRICGVRSRLDAPLETSEARFVDGTYRLGDGSRAEDGRFVEVRAALEDWGTALGNVTAHEIGHALGLDHDRGAGYVMQPRISQEDLSSDALAMSPASLRVLSSDVGIAAVVPGARRASEGSARSERHVLETDAESTLGALARRAAALGVRDEEGRIAVLSGDGAALRDPRLAGVPASGAGIVAALGDGEGSFVEGEVPAVREAIAARLRGHLTRLAATGGSPDLAFLAEGLSSAVPRIAADAALDLLSALEARREVGAEAAVAEKVALALARNTAAFGDLRAPIRLAGRAGAKEAVEEILAALAAESEIDLSQAAAEALERLGAREALARRAGALEKGPARARLLRTLARMPATTIADLEGLLADEDRAVSREAARTLLRAGPVERERLFRAAKRLPNARRLEIEALRERPRS